MKFEIEISHDGIRAAIDRMVLAAIADETASYRNEALMKDAVREAWKTTMLKIVEEECSNAPAIREKVKSIIEAKMKAKITALLRDKP